MKKIALLAAGLFLMTSMANTVSAQKCPLGWGVKAGFTVADMTNYLPGYGSKLGLTAGLFADYHFTKRWASSTELLYSSQGTRFNGDNKTQLHYLNIPMMANYYIIDGFAIKAGAQLGILLGAKQWVDGNSSSGTAGMNTAEFGIPIGASYEFPFGLILDARYNIGISKIYTGGGNIRNSVFDFTAGWRF